MSEINQAWEYCFTLWVCPWRKREIMLLVYGILWRKSEGKIIKIQTVKKISSAAYQY